jgi:CRISPR/Cas system CSM-associated protein Csm3 (group 7 of RAMP superfamily)
MPAELRVPTHASLESVLLFDYRLTCRTGLHIGVGKSSALAGSDLPVLRDADGRPMVPGSSLRGVLRSGVEALSKSLGLDSRCPSVSVANGDPRLPERLFGRVGQSKDDSFSFGSRLQISDARCDGDALTELRDGVSIRRDTRTVAGSAKFDLEVVAAGAKFRGTIRLKNGIDYEAGLVAQALWMLDQGLLLLGGNSARGLGWMEVQVSEPRRLTAADLLAASNSPPPGSSAGSQGGGSFGKVEVHLSPYLDALRKLATEPAPSASQGT